MVFVVLASTTMPATAAEPNSAPVAVDDPGGPCGISIDGISFPIWEDLALPFVLDGPCSPIANDYDLDGDPLTWEIVSQPEHGEAWQIDDTSAAYLPDLDFSTNWPGLPGGTADSDRFTYRVFDGQAFSAPATYRFFVVPINDPPTFEWLDHVYVEQDEGPYSVQWASNIDPGPFESDQVVSFRMVRGEAHGLMDFHPEVDASGILTFTTLPGEHGYADVTLYAQDNGDYHAPSDDIREVPSNRTEEVTFRVHVQPNLPPEAVLDDGIVVYQGPGATKLDLLANDTDLDGDALAIVSATEPEHGTVVVVDDGAFVSYDPDDGYIGQDWFEYTIEDARGGTSGPMFVVIDVRADSVTPKMGALSRSLPGQTIGSSTVVATLNWTASDVGSGVAGYQLQVSINGAGYKAVPLANPAATSLRTTMAVGASYAYRTRARDEAGNIGGYAYWPTVTPTRYQETSTIARYTGSWSRTVSSHLSGGASRYASSSTRRVTVTFTGREVAWVATKRTTGGRAEVRIDGVLVGTVDLDATSTQYRRIVFRRGFATRGTHTLEIRPLGDGRVELDAIIVLR
jgi:hypothetical protein